MNYLFDVAPTEVPDARAKRGRSPRKTQAEKPAAVAQVIHARRRNETIIGRSDGHYACADEACQSTQFDILDDYRGEWFIECMLCGTGQTVPAVRGVIQTPDDAGEFVFADGKFEGFTMSQAAAAENGPTYIAWAAKSHKREAVRLACKKWIDSRGGQA